MEGDNKVLQHSLERAARDRVSGDPLPGPLAQAFLEGDIQAGGLAIRPFVASDWVILRGLESPIIRLIEELAQNPKEDPKITISDEEKFEIIYQFTRPAKECRALLKRGKDLFRETATDFVDERKLNLVQMQECLNAAMEQIRRSWETTLKYQSDQGKGDGTKDFPQATPPTALGGGSNILAVLCEPSEASPQ